MEEQVIKVGSIDLNNITIVDLNGEVTNYNLKEMLLFNETNYEKAYVEQAKDYNYWGTVYSVCRAQEEDASNKLDKIHAEQYMVAFDELKGAGTARPTKDAIEAVVIQTLDYEFQLKAYTESKRLALQVQYIVKSLEQRKDMLIQFGAGRRKEVTYGN